MSEGHGVNTAGKRTPDGEREWTFNNLMGSGFREEIAKYNGVIVKLVSDPTGKRDTPLKERTDISNDWGADLYLSFHHNAYRGTWGAHTGTETFTYNKIVSKGALRLAQTVHPALVKTYGLYDRGLKRANFHELREPKAPAALTEGGYMDSSIDIKVMRDKNKVKEAGRNIARAVAKEYGLKLKPVAKPVAKPKPAQAPKPTTNTELIYRVQVGAFGVLNNAVGFAQTVEKKTGFSTYLVDDSDGIMRVQVGAFAVKANAENRLKELKQHFSDAFITTNGTKAIPEAEPQNDPVPPKPKPKKTVAQLADEVLAGKHGNGQKRKDSLGSMYEAVQAEVDKRAKSKAKPAPKPKPKPKAKKYPLPTGVYRSKKPTMSGVGVTQIQEALASVHFYPEKGAKNNGIDGWYGAKTADAVRRFQLVNGLKADGDYGAKTRAKLDSLVNK